MSELKSLPDMVHRPLCMPKPSKFTSVAAKMEEPQSGRMKEDRRKCRFDHIRVYRRNNARHQERGLMLGDKPSYPRLCMVTSKYDLIRGWRGQRGGSGMSYILYI